MANYFVNGFRVDEFGTLETSSGPISSWQQGLPFDEFGDLVVTTDTPDPSDPFVGELRVSPTKGVYIIDQSPPLVVSGFNNGYSPGFGNG